MRPVGAKGRGRWLNWRPKDFLHVTQYENGVCLGYGTGGRSEHLLLSYEQFSQLKEWLVQNGCPDAD